MNRSIKLALGVLLGSAILGGLPSTAVAQDDILSQNIPSLEFQEADVREALRSLFKSSHPATARSGPHPKLESRPSRRINPFSNGL